MNPRDLPPNPDDSFDSLDATIREVLREEGAIIPTTVEEVRRAKAWLKAHPITVPPHLRSSDSLFGKREQPATRESVEGKPVRHTQGIYFRRAAFDAYVIHTLADDPNLGRTKIEKITHLVEYHCAIDFEREPVRDAAGPVDYVSRRKVESLAKKQRWYAVVEATGRKGFRYMLGAETAKALPIAERTLGHQKSRVDALIEMMRPLNTRKCEIIATLYAAWNDLLLRGAKPSDEEILIEARENWHPKKLTIPTREWIEGLAWIRVGQLIPRGTGRRVCPANSASNG